MINGTLRRSLDGKEFLFRPLAWRSLLRRCWGLFTFMILPVHSIEPCVEIFVFYQVYPVCTFNYKGGERHREGVGWKRCIEFGTVWGFNDRTLYLSSRSSRTGIEPSHVCHFFSIVGGLSWFTFATAAAEAASHTYRPIRQYHILEKNKSNKSLTKIFPTLSDHHSFFSLFLGGEGYCSGKMIRADGLRKFEQRAAQTTSLRDKYHAHTAY